MGPDGEVIDEVLVSVMKAPHTYTKEDIVEVNCHGGFLVTQRVLQALLNAGARLAEPGEFTKRGFLNGRIDLTQAEAIIDLIQSKTELSRQAAVNQLEGRLKTEVRQMRQEIIDMIASIEAVIDYPDYDIEEETYDSMEKGAKKLLARMERLLGRGRQRENPAGRFADRYCWETQCRQILSLELVLGRRPRHRHRHSRYHP